MHSIGHITRYLLVLSPSLLFAKAERERVYCLYMYTVELLRTQEDLEIDPMKIRMPNASAEEKATRVQQNCAVS